MALRDHEGWFAPDGGAQAVKGFLSPLSAHIISLLLSFQLDNNITGSLVEIGTFMGKTFLGLAKASRADETVVGFDLYPDYVLEGFLRSVETLDSAYKSRLTAHKRNTFELSTTEWIGALKRPARFIHIDGGHTYAAIINDLQLASSYLAPNSIVLLDDFMHDWYPDLTEGMIDGLKASRYIVPIAVVPRLGQVQDGGTKLVCSSRDGAALYQNMLRERFADKGIQTRKLAGSDVLTFQGF